MSSEYQSFLKYLSATRLENSDVTLDMERLQSIREKFKELYDDNDLDSNHLRHQTIKKVMDHLKITDDTESLEYFDLAVKQRSDDDAKLEIICRVRRSAQFIEPTIPDSRKASPTKPLIEGEVVSIDEITCIIHQKSDQKEIKDFIEEFLYKQISSSTTNTMMDLFIRKQIEDRGIITFNRPRKRFRLVEPISLTDEFGSWTFDHFHGLLDFWLTLDKNEFPKQWKLHSQAKINYIIQNHLNTPDDDQTTTKHLERPSTKSLENFVRDICQIEDNGMFNKWYTDLTVKENIHSYAHLTNLNQKEWEQIRELPMNALKTIKSYVDREKQMVEQRKSKKTKDENPNLSLSPSELRANLHMIKLYFIRQLEDRDGIESIPRLDKFCVDNAFEEMRAEGYEDDGLFDDMKLFFQPLTVTHSELTQHRKLLEKWKQETEEEKKLADELKEKKKNLKKAQKDLIKLDDQLTSFKQKQKQLCNEFITNSEKQDNKSSRNQNELREKWLNDNTDLQKSIQVQNKLMETLAKEICDINATIDWTKERLEYIKKLPKLTYKIDRKLVKPHRGFIMYGPPGTGKSVIMSKLAKKIGIAMLSLPLAAGELERPLVGQSEAIILDLCMRGNRLPHLMCCVSIDEIDSLAPRRDEDSSEGKVAKISVLLSVIEGIKDVPNLMFFSATNRLHMMDEAFLRRMSGKFFVGRPSAGARRRILDGIPKIILQPYIREKLATATTNFSGAALKALTSAITVDYIAKRRLCATYEMQEDEALILADRTARQFQLFLGLDTLPRLLLYNLDDQRRFSEAQATTTTTTRQKEPLPMGFHLSENYQFTGKILISLTDQCARLEILQNDNTRRTIEEPLTKGEQSLQQLLERITSYGNDRNVQLLQLIDLNLLSSKGAHDEKKIFETLKERYDECMEYKRSMIVYDLDSLIGVNKSESESSMGTSVSSSVVNQSIYIYVTSRFREAKIEAKRSDQKMSIERWAIAVVRDDFLLKKFTTDVDFMLTDQQKSDDENHRKLSKDLLFCVKCRDNFVETENKMGACTYHDGFLYDNLSLDLKMHKPSQATEILYAEESIAVKDPTKKDEMERSKTRFKYICCHATFQVGAGMNGCRKGEHGREKNEDGWEKVKIDAKLYKAIKIGITKWEKDCSEDIGYNLKLIDLLQSRKT